MHVICIGYILHRKDLSLRKIYGSSILKLNTAEDLYLFLAAIENNKNKRTAEEIINDISNINKYVYY